MVASSVEGFPNGAGGCGVAPSVNGKHLDIGTTEAPRTVTVVDFATGERNVTIRVAGVKYVAGTTAFLQAGKTYEITLTGNNFKGFLIRLAGNPVTVPLAGTIVPASSAGQVAPVCTAPTVGVTHVDNINKNEAKATLKFKSAVNVTVGITVVYNNMEISEYSSASFNLAVCKKKPCGFIRSLFGLCDKKCTYA